MKTERELFEELPEIAEIIKEGVFWDGEIYRRTAICKLTHLYYVRGAWYAFQEQQKKVARLQSALDELEEWCQFQLCENDGTQWDAGWCASHRRILNEINRITEQINDPHSN